MFRTRHIHRGKLALLASTTISLCLATSASAQEFQWSEGIEPIGASSSGSVTHGSVNTADGASVDRDVYFTNNYYDIPAGTEVGAYFATWGVYGRDYAPQNVPVERLTHVYVAFGVICGDHPGAYEGGRGAERICDDPQIGETAAYYVPDLTDPMTDDEVTFVDDEWAWFDRPVNGNFNAVPDSMAGAMMQWKERNPNLKIVISIGGWSYSRPFYDVLPDANRRATVIASLIENLRQPGYDMIDGIDMDFEFPGGLGLDTDKGNPSVDGAAYLEFMKEMRVALDELGEEKGRDYELTAAIGLGEQQLANWAQSSKIGDFLQYIDRLGLMTYDFEGAWSPHAGLNSALAEPFDTPQVQSIDGAINTLMTKHNVTQDQLAKISVGYPSYSRSNMIATGLTDPSEILFASAQGQGGSLGTVEKGILSYFDLAARVIGTNGDGINGWKIYNYPEFAATVAYNPNSGEFHSFMSPQDVEAVSEYVAANGLHGVFTWQVDDDNGELLESALLGLGLQRGSAPVGQPVAYAPSCASMIDNVTIKPDMTFSAGGNVHKATGWATKCPGEGESWEQSYWQDLGPISSFLAFGVDESDGGDTGGNDTGGDTGGSTGSNDTGSNDTGSNDTGSNDTGSNDTSGDDTGGDTGGDTTSNDTGDTDEDTGSSGGTSQYVEGTSYADGDIVYNEGANYRCTLSAWCSGPAWAYAPGTGTAWEQAWEFVSEADSPEADGGDTGGETSGNTSSDTDSSDGDTGGSSSSSSGDWSASTVYTQGDQVSYDGKTWEAQWWTQGEEPGSLTWGAWKEVAGSTDSGSDTGGEDTGSSTSSDGDTGESSGSSSGDNWSASSVYTKGDQVIYDGKTWEAQWWTQGEEPGSLTWGAWKEL